MANFLDNPIVISQAQSQLASMQREAAEVFEKLTQYTQRSYDLIWHNPDSTCPPEKMWAELGSAGLSALVSHAAAVTFIETVKPGTLNPRFMTAPRPYVVNEDGSISLS